MSRKTLAIVSSYNTQCGNASYTHVLKEEFSKHFDTSVIPVNFRLLGDDNFKARQAAQQHINDLCVELRKYDYVNIQFEAGLFGFNLNSACMNVTPLINASRSLTFTIHRIYKPTAVPSSWRSWFKNPLRLRKTLRRYKKIHPHEAFAKLVALVETKSKGGTASIIVHTQREREILALYYDARAVVDFPITFLNREQIRYHIDKREDIRDDVFQHYRFDRNSKYIGVFGFLSENKGHHIAVNALRFLPHNYKLAIFGSQHPLSIKEYNLGEAMKTPALFEQNNNTYISSLVDLAETFITKDLRLSETENDDRANSSDHRVRFLGNVDDSEFIRAIVAMDYVVVPYVETGQGGSGNAALIIELQAKAVFSRTFAFMELARYYPDCFIIADIANSLQIAQMILNWTDNSIDAQRHASMMYNIENGVLIHLRAFERGAQAAMELKYEMIGLHNASIFC